MRLAERGICGINYQPLVGPSGSKSCRAPNTKAATRKETVAWTRYTLRCPTLPRPAFTPIRVVGARCVAVAHVESERDTE